MTKKPTLTKAVYILSAPFSRNGHSTTTLLQEAKTSLSALCTVLKLRSNESSLVELTVGINDSEGPK